MLVFFIIICQVSASAGLCYNLWRYHSQQNRSESLLSWSSCSSGKVTDSIELPLTLTAAAPAKSLQSCPTLCNPIDSSPPGSPIPGILQARNTGVGCHFLLQYGAHESLDIQLCSYWAILHTTHIDYGKIIFYLIKR